MSNKTPNLMSDLMSNKVSDCCARYRSIPTCTSGGPTDLELLCTVWQPRRGGAANKESAGTRNEMSNGMSLYQFRRQNRRLI